jgi:hypothetical protein
MFKITTFCNVLQCNGWSPLQVPNDHGVKEWHREISQTIYTDVLTPKLFNEKNVSKMSLHFSEIHGIAYKSCND